MLDLEKRSPEQEQMASAAVSDAKVLSDLLDGLLSKKCAVRYKNFKAVFLISEDHPEVLYPKWVFFEDMLKSGNATYIFYAIHVLANLARVDSGGRFEKVFNEFYGILNGDELVPACHVAYVSHKIVKAKPQLIEEVIERLLHLDKATYKHRELVQANALYALSEFYDKIPNKKDVLNLARELHKSKSARAKKEAVAFFKKWGSA